MHMSSAPLAVPDPLITPIPKLQPYHASHGCYAINLFIMTFLDKF
jgi:hypothetical protein